MFPSFIGILDIQSWWEVPSIAYFCSLFRTAFNLLDFDIEELEEALLTDGSEECASTLLTELIVRLLNGCLGNNDISAFNYQMFLRRLFRQKCQETGRYNPFNTDIDFQFLPLRTKVEILYALCDFRLDAEDVFELFKNLEAESLRVEPLGWDDNSSAYWYFYGTRLYREDYKKTKNKKKKNKEEKRKRKLYGDDWQGDQNTERVWQVVCFTEADWNHLTEKFKSAASRVEKELYQSLSENFLPEIPRLFQEKERLQRKRLLELAPRRTSNRVLQKIKQKEEEDKQTEEVVQEIQPVKEEDIRKGKIILGREYRAKRREQLRSKSVSSDSSEQSSSSGIIMSQKDLKSNLKTKEKKSKNLQSSQKGEPPPEPPMKTGRKTNNSLACATGQIVIPDTVDSGNSTRKKLKTSQIFSQSEEDIQTDMYKVLEQLTAHEDAWPFMDPVEEEYAPNYYAVIRRPMDLRKMEERLDSGFYTDFAAFKGDFKLIVNNCRLYNGQDNEYTVMVDSLQEAFDRLTERYINRISSSDEEIAVEYQMPTPSRKHKIKPADDSPSNDKKKRKRSESNSENPTSSPERVQEDVIPEEEKINNKKEIRKSKEGKIRKKHKQHHHSKHSRSHKKTSHHKSLSKEERHLKKLEKKKEKQRKKKHRQSQKESEIILKRSSSQESLESSNRSRSASPLPSIHTPSPTPSPSPPPTDQLADPNFFKDKYDKIKERRRQATKDSWDTLVDFKQKNIDKQKQNLLIPDKDKNQKLRETIEKLKAKNEKYKETLIFNNLFSASSQTSADKSSNSSEILAEASSLKDLDQYEFIDESDNGSQKSQSGKKSQESNGKKAPKKISAAKNESATEALEQAVKDISKWLDDAPKAPPGSSPNSPAPTVSTEDSRLDDDFSNEKSLTMKKDSKKRPSSREQKIPSKRRELQRTIERLQPGKSKGNLLTNAPTKLEEVLPLGPHNKTREIKSVLTTKVDELSPKLSLGSVLPAVGFTLGKDHKFSEEERKVIDKPKSPDPVKSVDIEESPIKDTEVKPVPEPLIGQTKGMDVVKDMEEPDLPKFSQEKATPNLSAWFKAFGAPKSVPPIKKRNDETEQDEKPPEIIHVESKPASPKSVQKYDSPPDEISPIPEGGDSPIANVTTTPRQRRTSTGSSISERSSFSQDLDSPRHQIAHSSPLLRSPASPRTDSDFQKITYPIINGTVRAGFYQDTASIKSSPEKSCSPREAPKSPYSPYSQHVYASNNAAAASNQSYFADHNKSPLPTYGLIQPPPYYDSSKAPIVNKPSRIHDDYTALGPDTSYQQTPSQLTGAYSPAPSPYSQHSQHSPYSHVQSSPQTVSQNSPAATTPVQDTKSSLFPVKKRSYNEVEIPFPESKPINQDNSGNDVSDTFKNCQIKEDFQKIVHSMNTVQSDFVPTSVDDIALALSNKKAEAIKINTMKENSGLPYMDRQLPSIERHDIAPNYNGGVIDDDRLKQGLEHNMMQSEKLNDSLKAGNIDMVNMGYFVTELERKSGITDSDLLNAAKDLQKSNLSKGFDIGAIAMDLGTNKVPLSKYGQSPKHVAKGNAGTNIEKVHNDHLNQNLLEFDNIHAANQSVTNFSLNDFENVNKKLYSSGTATSCTALDYGKWKVENQMRKPEPAHSNYQNTYGLDNNELAKMKTNINTSNPNVNNFNKNLHTQQLQALAGATRAPMLRAAMQHNLQSELRIPNPRGMMKNDFISDICLPDSELMGRNVDGNTGQKTDKGKPNQILSNSLQYKPPFSNHSAIPLDTLRNIPNLPQMLERYTNDERYLSNFGGSSSSLYHDKNLQMAQMFNKSLPSDMHPVSNASSVHAQAANQGQVTQPNSRANKRRKRTDETKHTQISGNQTYHSQPSSEVLSSVKPSLVPGSAFNFGPTTGMGLSGSLYSDNSGFTLEDFRNTTANQFMAANYIVAAAAAHQRNTTDTNVEKLVKPAHQNTAHSGAGTFPFIGHGQVRAAYPFGGVDPSSPLYQQYLQRHQEELIRQTGAQIMGLYPPGYHPSGLGTRQPYDSMNRPSWL